MRKEICATIEIKKYVFRRVREKERTTKRPEKEREEKNDKNGKIRNEEEIKKNLLE